MFLKLSNHQPNTHCYMYRILWLIYMNLMVTKPNSCKDTQKIERKESKHNTKKSFQIAREENKRRKEQRSTTETTRKQ